MLDSREVLSRHPGIRIEVCIEAVRQSLQLWQIVVRFWDATVCRAFWDLGMIREEILVGRKIPRNYDFT